MKETAKEAVLARIRRAIANAPELPPIPRDFRERDERNHAAILEEFIDRLLDYKAIVTHTEGIPREVSIRAPLRSPTINRGATWDYLPQAIADACQQHNIIRLVVPADLPTDWVPAGVTVLRDDPPLDNTALDESSGVLTGCAVAIAQTGTIILDGGAYQGRRALSLVPDRHLCIVRSEQIVGLVPEAIARLAERASHPITFISGPSATSDIELIRVEGVHGPRTLHVFVVNDR